MDDDSESMNIPVQIRGHEQAQLETLVTDVRRHFEQQEDGAETDAAVESFRESRQQFEELEAAVHDDDGERQNDRFARYLSLDIDQWQQLILGLRKTYDEHGRNRVEYLQRKLMRRVDDRVRGIE